MLLEQERAVHRKEKLDQTVALVAEKLSPNPNNTELLQARDPMAHAGVHEKVFGSPELAEPEVEERLWPSNPA